MSLYDVPTLGDGSSISASLDSRNGRLDFLADNEGSTPRDGCESDREVEPTEEEEETSPQLEYEIVKSLVAESKQLLELLDSYIAQTSRRGKVVAPSPSSNEENRDWDFPVYSSEPCIDGSMGIPQPLGLSKLRQRFVCELQAGQRSLDIAEEAVCIEEGLIDAEDAKFAISASTSQRYSKCNLVGIHRMFVSLLFSEPGVMAVCYPVRDQRTVVLPATKSSTSSSRAPAAARKAAPQSRPTEVDLITNYGRRWIKVKAFSAKNAALDITGDASGKVFTTVVENLKAISSVTWGPFGRHPEVAVAIREPLAADLVRHIESCGATTVAVVDGDLASLAPASSPPLPEAVNPRQLRPSFPHTPMSAAFVNFDVTSLVAMISDTCNGHAGHHLPKHRVLDEQLQFELTDPALERYIVPTLSALSRELPNEAALRSEVVKAMGGIDPWKGDHAADIMQLCPYLAGDATAAEESADLWAVKLPLKTPGARRNWIVTDVALSEFTWIIDTIAGPNEHDRARRLIPHLTVVPVGNLFHADGAALASASGISGVFQLTDTNKIYFRHRAVFGIGDLAHAVTLSANQQFVQAAKDQGVETCVRFHPSRALTERKRCKLDRLNGPRRPPDIYPSLANPTSGEGS